VRVDRPCLEIIPRCTVKLSAALALPHSPSFSLPFRSIRSYSLQLLSTQHDTLFLAVDRFSDVGYGRLCARNHVKCSLWPHHWTISGVPDLAIGAQVMHQMSLLCHLPCLNHLSLRDQIHPCQPFYDSHHNVRLRLLLIMNITDLGGVFPCNRLPSLSPSLLLFLSSPFDLITLDFTPKQPMTTLNATYHTVFYGPRPLYLQCVPPFTNFLVLVLCLTVCI